MLFNKQKILGDTYSYVLKKCRSDEWVNDRIVSPFCFTCTNMFNYCIKLSFLLINIHSILFGTMWFIEEIQWIFPTVEGLLRTKANTVIYRGNTIKNTLVINNQNLHFLKILIKIFEFLNTISR